MKDCSSTRKDSAVWGALNDGASGMRSDHGECMIREEAQREEGQLSSANRGNEKCKDEQSDKVVPPRKNQHAEAENIHRTHIDTLRKLKSNPEINLKRGEEIVKSACVFVSDDVLLKRKIKVPTEEFIKRLSMNAFHLYFPPYASCYNEISMALLYLNGDVGDIIMGLKYLIENMNEINFLVLSFVEKLKRKKKVKNNQVVLHLIEFLQIRLCEENLNYKYGREHMLDFYDNLMHTRRTFFESGGLVKDAVDVKDLRLIYLYTHGIRMKGESSFVKEVRPPNSDSPAEGANPSRVVNGQVDSKMSGQLNSEVDTRNFVITNSGHKLNFKCKKKKKRKKKLVGEIPVPNVHLGLHSCFREKSIYDVGSCDLFFIKKKMPKYISKCIGRYMKGRNMCRSSDTDICTCPSSIIVSVFSDAKLREKVNMAKKEVKSVKNALVKIKRIENLVERMIKYDPENVMCSDGGETFPKSASQEIHKRDEEDSDAESEESIKTHYYENYDFNFVFLGSVKKGSDRHRSLLFKLLCDSVDIPCRFVRYVKNQRIKYFNLVLVPSLTGEDKNENNLKCSVKDINFELHQIWERHHEVVNIDEYFTFEKKLGMGGFGEVWDVSLKEDKEPQTSFFFPSIKDTTHFALKIMDMNEFNLNESVILREKAHTNVVKIYCTFKGYQVLLNRQHQEEKKECLCFLLQLADTSLEKVFCDKEAAYNLNFVRLTLLEIANVMSFIHKQNAKQEFYIYRDLKPDNVLIKGKKILLTDFNLSRKVDQDFEYLMSQCCGTKGHLAPEQKSVAYNRTVDIWAFGVIVSKFLKHKNFHYFSHGGYKVDLKHFEVQDKFLINLLLCCIDENPFMRPTFGEISRMLINEIVRNELERYGRATLLQIAWEK
ncbi:serine/threonine protein kinase [Plasmodium fragile]|uniref:Serine/threonine protein kinase n=1 Tax=Plasmodium fragile TaxID=5857 RepID=A0A0D9QKG1_PLAFR|nr:serine/threonine protein kinase [Plasmodium fragile]KJP87453.1 serine/threonine protein kinase [Plasmodium fragile]